MNVSLPSDSSPGIAAGPQVPPGASAALLAADLEKEIRGRKIERFFWIFAVLMLSYAIIVRTTVSGIAHAGLLLLLIVFVFGVAAWLGIQPAAVIAERAQRRWFSR